MPRWAAITVVAASAALYAAVTVPAALRPAEGVDTVLFFDGVCNLCDGFVNFVADHDSSRRVRFGAIQRHADALHRAGAGRYAEGGAEALSTLVVIQDDVFYLRSDAVRKSTSGNIAHLISTQVGRGAARDRAARRAVLLRRRVPRAAGGAPGRRLPARRAAPLQVVRGERHVPRADGAVQEPIPRLRA